jgi:hypothetical protein
LVKESRAVIDAVAIAQPRTWSDVHAIIVVAKRGAAKTAKGEIAPRTSKKIKRLENQLLGPWRCLLSALVA